MASRWQLAADEAVSENGADWSALWSLMQTTAGATFDLSMTTPLNRGVELTLAAMEVTEARDDLDCARPGGLEAARVVRLGPPAATDDLAQSLTVLTRLLDHSLDVALAVLRETTVGAEADALRRAISRLRSARRRLSAQW